MSEDLVKNRDYSDFPFEEVSDTRWALSMGVLFGGFLWMSLSGGFIFSDNDFINGAMNFLLFIFVEISSLFVLDFKWPKRLLKPLKLKDLFIIIAVLILTYAAAFFSLSFLDIGEAVENPVVDFISKDNMLLLGAVLFIQLFVEEVLFVVPFLFIYNKFKDKSKVFALMTAWILSSLIFGALHLPTYSFNFAQSFLVIGSIRFVLSFAYIWRKNLLLPYIIHVLYDGLIFLFIYIAKTQGLV
ncbi:putative membrane protein [Peptoniphilus sp. ING2-D1G]|nr:putative membrane protein [Peptoniphilus sp. ING2-D1G]